MRGEVVPSRPEMSRSMAISAKIPSVMPVELIPPENSKCGGQKMTHYGSAGNFFRVVRQSAGKNIQPTMLANVHSMDWKCHMMTRCAGI